MTHPAIDPAMLAADVLREHAPGFRPRLGIVLGSGLGGLADALDDAVAIPYAEIPGFPPSTVAGHAGRFVLGTLDGVPVACMQAASTSTRATPRPSSSSRSAPSRRSASRRSS